MGYQALLYEPGDFLEWTGFGQVQPPDFQRRLASRPAAHALGLGLVLDNYAFTADLED